MFRFNFLEGSTSEGIPKIVNILDECSGEELWQQLQVLVEIKNKNTYRFVVDQRALPLYNILAEYSLAELDLFSIENLLQKIITEYPQAKFIIPNVTQEAIQLAISSICENNGAINLLQYFLLDSRVTADYDNNIALFLASQNGHVAVVKELLAHKEVNCLDPNHHALDVALNMSHFEIVTLLMASITKEEKKSFLSSPNVILLFNRACQTGNHRMAACLLEQNYQNFSGCLKLAAENGQVKILKLLMKNAEMQWLQTVSYFGKLIYQNQCIFFAEYERQFALSEAAKRGHTACVKFLLKVCGNKFQLLPNCIEIVAERGHQKVVEILLANNLNYVSSVLLGAIKGNQIELIKYIITCEELKNFIKNLAHPNFQELINSMLEKKATEIARIFLINEIFSREALNSFAQQCIIKNNIEIFKIIITLNPDVKFKAEGNQLLQEAAVKGDLDSVTILLSNSIVVKAGLVTVINVVQERIQSIFSDGENLAKILDVLIEAEKRGMSQSKDNDDSQLLFVSR